MKKFYNKEEKFPGMKEVISRSSFPPKTSGSAQPSPGASPTEDGLIEKALRVREAFALAGFPPPEGRMSVLMDYHKPCWEVETKEERWRFIEREDGLAWHGGFLMLFPRPYDLSNLAVSDCYEALPPTVQAVLAASGQEIGQAETQAPSTTSHQTENRCPICGWTYAETWEQGCVPGNCSYRPREGTDEYRRIQANRARLEDRGSTTGLEKGGDEC